MRKVLLLLLITVFLSGCAGVSLVDTNRLTQLENDVKTLKADSEKQFNLIVEKMRRQAMLMAEQAGANFYPARSHTGGAAGDLDNVANPSDKDVGFVVTNADGTYGNAVFIYSFDDDASAGESVPTVIAPDTGSGEWELVNVWGTNVYAVTAFLPDASDGATLGNADNEFADLYLADGGKILGQDNQSNTIESSANGWIFNLDINLADGKSIKTGTASADWSSWQATDDVGDSPVQKHIIKATNSGDAAAILLEIGGDETKTQIVLDAAPDMMADDNWSGIAVRGLLAGSDIAQFALVYLASDGKFDEADADNALFPAFGVAVECPGGGGWPCQDTEEIVVLIRGFVRNDGWPEELTPGDTLYLDDTANGDIDDDPPATSTDCIQVVGKAISVDEVFFNITGHWLLVE